MYCAHRDPRDSHAGEDVPEDLEAPHGERGPDDCPCGSSEFRKSYGGAHEDEAEPRNETKLYEREGDGVAELVHDGFAGI